MHHGRLGEYAIEIEQAGPAVLRDAKITSHARGHGISLESLVPAGEGGFRGGLVPAGAAATPVAWLT